MPRICTLALMTLTTGLLLVGCSSDDKTDSTSSDGGVTVTEATGGTKVDMVLSDTAGLDAPQTMTAEPLTLRPARSPSPPRTRERSSTRWSC